MTIDQAVEERQLSAMASVSTDRAYEGKAAAEHDLFAGEGFTYGEAIYQANEATAAGLLGEAAFYAGYAFAVRGVR